MKKRPVLAVILATASAAGALPGLSAPDPGSDDATTTVASPLSAQPQDVERALSAASREEQKLRQRLRRLEQEQQGTRARIVSYGRAYVRSARAGMLPLGAGFPALVDHAAALARFRRGAGRSIDEKERLDQDRRAVVRALEEMRVRRVQLETQRQALAQASTALMAAQDRALAFERAFLSSGPGGHTAVYGSAAGPSAPTELGAGFGAMRGKLPFPLPGRTEIIPATRPGSDGSGLDMRAPPGSPVRAVHHGRVAFADDYAAFGRTVIVDHGDRYYTVSGGLGEIGVAVGEELSAGARLGTVGSAPGGGGIYFEIRHGVDTLPPAEWFGI